MQTNHKQSEKTTEETAMTNDRPSLLATIQQQDSEIQRLRRELAAVREELRKARSRLGRPGANIHFPVSIILDYEDGSEIPTQFLADANGVYLALIYEDPMNTGYGYFPGPLAGSLALGLNRLAVDRPETETER